MTAEYRFDQIAIVSTEKKKPVEDDKRNYIGLEHLSSDTFEVANYGSEVAPKGEKLIMRKGDVLFGKRRAYQKKVGIAPCDGIFSAHGMVLRPNEEIVDARFFPFFIKSDAFLDEAIRISVGSLSPTVNWRDLRELQFILPSLSRQREIAELLWAGEELKTIYRRLLTACDSQVKSRFIEMFGDPVENDKSWPISTVRDTSTSFGDGPFGSNLKASHYVDEGVRVIRLGNIGMGKFLDEDKSFISYEHFERLRKYRCESGQVVIGTLGDPNLRACLVPALDVPCIHKADCVYYATDVERVLPVFAMQVINQPAMLSFATRHVHGNTRGRVSSSQVAQLPMILPPIELQREFVALVQQVDKSELYRRRQARRMTALRVGNLEGNNLPN